MSDAKTGSAFLIVILAAMVLPCVGTAQMQQSGTQESTSTTPSSTNTTTNLFSGKSGRGKRRNVELDGGEGEFRIHRHDAGGVERRSEQAEAGWQEAEVSGSSSSRAQAGARAAADRWEPQVPLARKVLRQRISFLQHSRVLLSGVRRPRRSRFAFPVWRGIPLPVDASGRRAVLVPR